MEGQYNRSIYADVLAVSDSDRDKMLNSEHNFFGAADALQTIAKRVQKNELVNALGLTREAWQIALIVA